VNPIGRRRLENFACRHFSRRRFRSRRVDFLLRSREARAAGITHKMFEGFLAVLSTNRQDL